MRGSTLLSSSISQAPCGVEWPRKISTLPRNRRAARELQLQAVEAQRMGRYEEAYFMLRDANVRLSQFSDTESQTWVAGSLQLMSACAADMGKFDTAGDGFTRAIAEFKRLGQEDKERGTAHNLLLLHIKVGNLRKARRVGQEYPLSMYEATERGGVLAHITASRLSVIMGDTDGARGVLRRVEPHIDSDRDRALWLRNMAWTFQREKDFEWALEYAHEAIRAAESGARDLLASIYRICGECYLEQTKVDKASLYCCKCAGQAKETKDLIEEAAILSIQGGVAVLRGQHNLGRNLAETSIRMLDNIGCRIWAAITRWRFANCALFDDKTSAELRSAAIAYFKAEGFPMSMNDYEKAGSIWSSVK